MKWIRTTEQMPPSRESVVTWKDNDFGHAHYDPECGWFWGCECFPGDEPDFWMIPTAPESEEPKHARHE